jgi:hypothetical protein
MSKRIIAVLMVVAGVAYGSWQGAMATLWTTLEPVGGELWTPADLPNILSWNDASDLGTLKQNSDGTGSMADGERVGYWESKVGSVLYTTAAAARPFYTNGYVSFSAASYYLAANSSYLGASTNFTIAAVVLADANGKYPFASYTGNKALYLHTGTTSWRIRNRDAGAQTKQADASTTYNTQTMVAARAWGTRVAVSVDGGVETGATNVLYDTSTVFDDATTNLGLGPGVNFSNGRMWEIIIVGDNTSSDDIDRIYGYFAHKWGLTANLPEAHPYKNAAPTK